MMNITNAIVIYFAVGMPFGVLSIALLRGRVEPVDLFRVIYDLVFWPLIVFKSALAHLRSPAQSRNPGKISRRWDRNDFNTERRANRLKALSRTAVLEGMNAIYIEMFSANDLSSFFHECVDHPKPKLAAKCIQRRSIARLERHIQTAHEEISRSPDGSTSHDRSDDQPFSASCELLHPGI